jgi:ribosomal protein L7Ae-like RNA K-turn-binding protein
MQTLSMAKRAGELCFGFTKVDEALRSHTAAVYVVASDAKENGREKLERLAIFQNLPVLDNWSSAELSAAIGEENVIHVALATGGLTQKLLELLTKLKAVKSET